MKIIKRKEGVVVANKIFDFTETGVLKLDKIFFESYYPILFTCISEKKDIFLCVCCQADSNVRKWLITDVSPRTIIELLSNKITIRESFLKDEGSKYTVIYNMEDENFEIEENNIKDWDEENSMDLPTAGEYMDAEEDEFLEEIEYFKGIEIHYEDYEEQKIGIMIKKGKISCKKDLDINVYKNSCYSVKYIIEGMEEFKNNRYYKVLHNIKKDEMPLFNKNNISVDSFVNFVFEVAVDNILADTAFCINNNISVFPKAA